MLYLGGVTEGTTQWRAETLQMVNWGGFHGHYEVAFADIATLLSGASGTGKSTLLDAYLALMMPSDTHFNGASNDATTGRARSADQRNLVTYLRGKTDSARESGTGELIDQVLRGQDTSTWGAVGMTFIDDTKRRYTVFRVYFVPRGASNFGEITMKMATTDGYFDLTELETLADTKFDKRAMKTRFPLLSVHDTYATFSQTLFTRLGIGANGDGSKALRLLARIQSGQQVRTVDDLYKSMVIEPPSTFAAADKAVAHFADLEASYEAMLTEHEKQRVLDRIPGLWENRETAVDEVDLIDTFGIHRDAAEDTPFRLWALRTEDRLLEAAEDRNGLAREQTQDRLQEATRDEAELEGQLAEVQAAQRAAGGAQLKRIETDISRLTMERDAAERARDAFDRNTAILDLSIDTSADFAAARAAAERFAEEFDERVAALDTERSTLMGEQWPLQNEKTELRAEAESLSGRAGRVPRDFHEARLLMAHHAGLAPDDLVFVAELIDLLPDETHWRKAAETVLHGLARVLLISDRDFERVSRAIDPVKLPTRINFEGVPAAAFRPVRLDPDYVSGKLAYKDHPFSHWVQERVSSSNTDALCVGNPDQLGDGGRRVTANGQTRYGGRGAHGEFRTPNIIGFSNEERLSEIQSRLTAIDTELARFDELSRALCAKVNTLHARKAAQTLVQATEWAIIDHGSVTVRIDDLQGQYDRILAASDRLRALQQEEVALSAAAKAATGTKALERKALENLLAEQARIIDRKDECSRAADRIENAQSVTLTGKQHAYLDAEFAKVTDPDDLDQFPRGVDRLRGALAAQSKTARDRVTRATETLTGIFQAYQNQWPDQNLGTGIESYQAYRDILDRITATGLHERRKEWSRRVTDWSGQDLVPLAGAFETSISEIEDRLRPVNDILAKLPFGDRQERLAIDLRRLKREDISQFRKELAHLSKVATADFDDDQIEKWFKRIQRFMNVIRADDTTVKGGMNKGRDYYLDVRKHIVITAVALDANGVERSTYAALGGKSGGETQELIAFIVGAALRYQLGDDVSARPRFAPVFLDEGFVKSDSEFAGRAVSAWKGLGFQLIIGAPLDKVTALEPHVDKVLGMTKSPAGYSFLVDMTGQPAPAQQAADLTAAEATG
jgi:uncharacterized protein YPO0396